MERPLTNYLNQKARAMGIPLSGVFEMSPVCNLSCKMCYVRRTEQEVKAHNRPILTLSQWKELGDKAFEAGTLFLLLTGGEPFLYKDFRELYEYLHAKGFLISINTNGTLIDDGTVKLLSEMPPARVNVTLYGAGSDTYKRLCGVGLYDKVTENIDKLINAGICVKLNCSLTPENAGDIENIVKFARERHIQLEMSAYMFPPARREAADFRRFTPKEAAYYTLEYIRLSKSEEEYRGFVEQAAKGQAQLPPADESCIDPVDGKVRCQAGRSSYWITWDGYMLPCGMFTGVKSDIAAGFDKAWSDIREKISGLILSGVCEKCGNRGICHCCLSMAYAETGSPSGVPKYLCEMTEEVCRMAKLITNYKFSP